MSLSAKQKATIEKVREALRVARILRAQHGYDPAGGLSRNTIKTAIRIVKPVIVGKAARERFIRDVCYAVEDLELARHSNPSRKEALARAEALAHAARALQVAWADAAPLHNSMRRWFRAGRPGSEEDVVAVAKAGDALFERGEQFMGNEIGRFVNAARGIESDLNNCTTRTPVAVQLYVWALAAAWKVATGNPPTLTRNEYVVCAPRSTAFLNLIRAVTPAHVGEAPIGDFIVKEVVDAFRALGEIERQNLTK